jgi:hypothetical protein
MKCLTIRQPWATLIACGLKRFETRSWSTKHRGLLAIHAGMGFDRPGATAGSLVQSALAGLGVTDPARELVRGHVIAVTRLIAVHQAAALRVTLDARELALGDYTDGRFAWELQVVERLNQPAPARGRLGLWEWAGAGGASHMTVQRVELDDTS